MAKELKECRLSSQQVFSGDLLDVRKDEVALPNGRKAWREYIVHPGAVVVIAWLDKETIIMERQHRYPLGQDFFELPAGKIDGGEDRLIAAKRELLEETGYTAQTWKSLAVIHPCIGYSNEAMHLYAAEDLMWQGQSPDPDELLDIISIKLSDALSWVRQGKITDAKSIIGIFWAEKISTALWT